MGNKSQATFAKRQKELARQAKQKEKHAKKLEAKQLKAEAGTVPGAEVEAEDPDLAGIRLGPQPTVDDDEASGSRERA